MRGVCESSRRAIYYVPGIQSIRRVCNTTKLSDWSSRPFFLGETPPKHAEEPRDRPPPLPTSSPPKAWLGFLELELGSRWVWAGPT